MLLLAPPPLTAAPRPGPHGDPQASDVRLHTLGEEFVARRLARAPHAVKPGGIAAGEPLAGKVSASALAGEVAWLHGFRERLAAVPGEGHEGERATVRALLESAIERELVELEVLRPFERDPGAYLALVAGSVEAALDRSGSSSCARAQRAARRLAEVPEVLRAARLNLKDPPRVLTEIAIDRCAGVLRFYREEVPRRAAGCRSAGLQADLAQADTIAVRAVERFLDYLAEDLLPVSRGEPAIGAEGCRRLMRAALAAEVAPIETLLAEATRRVGSRRAEWDSVASLVTDDGESAALEPSPGGAPDDDAAAPFVARSIARLEEFLAGHEVVTLPSRPSLGVREAPSFRRSRAIALPEGGVPPGPRPGPAWLEVGGPEPPTAGGGAPGRSGRFDRRDVDLAVAHEGLPGRYLRAVVLRGTSSRLRRALQETWPGEDWGQYCERMMLEEGFGGGDPRYREAGAARALRQAGVALAALGFHSGAMSRDDARRMLEERCLLDSADAEREARSAAAEPARMSYTFGAQRLRELQDEARRRLGPRYRTRTFNDAVLRCGASPHGIVRDLLWRELADATGDIPVGAGP